MHGKFAMALAVGLALGGAAQAATFTVNTDGSANASLDATNGNYCDTNSMAGNQNICTLQAAIQLANDVPGFDTIAFQNGFTKVTLASSLQPIIERVVVDGRTNNAGNPRVEIDGNNTNGCFDASGNGYPAGGGPPLVPQANNSRFEFLVVHNCSGNGITIGGHGYVVSNSYIGVLPNGTTASGNSSMGISVSASLADGGIPVLPNLPIPELNDLGSTVTFLLSILPNLAPNAIVGNVISGNDVHGVDIHGMYSAATIVFDNKIGTNAAGTAPLPNGGGGGTGHGIQLSASTYANIIGLDNVIAGNNDGSTMADGIGDPQSYGVDINTGAVPFPNVIAGNFIGTSLQSAFLEEDLGNALAGIYVSGARPTTAADGPSTVDNPLDLALIIGPGNVVGFNGHDEALNLPGDFEQTGFIRGGIIVGDANSIGVKIFGNLVGVSESVVGAIDIGNIGDGINVAGTLHEVGGESIVLGNAVGSNDRHGIVVRSTRTRVHGNSIGTFPIGEFDQHNDGNGVWITAGGNAIGKEPIDGEADEEANRIAFNQRHAIQLTGSNAWSVAIRENEIFGVPVGFLGIDLDRPIGTPDINEVPADDRDPSGSIRSYTNWQQNTLGFDSGSYSAGTTTLAATLNSAPSSTYRVEFFSSPDARGAKTFLGMQNAVTNAAGVATINAALGGSPDTRGQFIVATVTDLEPTNDADNDPFPPGLTVHGPANNTSEFSAPFQIPDDIAFSAGTYPVSENIGNATITLVRNGVGNDAVDVTVTLTDTTTEAADHGALAPSAVVSWANGDTAPKQLTLPITEDAIDEINETLELELAITSGTAVEGTPNTATVVITDNDPSPTVSIAAGNAVEGGPMVFTVTRVGDTEFPITVNYVVAPAAGTEAADIAAGDDALTGMLTLPAGTASDTISILAVDDAIFEGAEDVTATISNPVNATLGTASATGTIAASDVAPSFSIDSVNATETDANQPLVFTVTKTGLTESAATVDYATAPGSATTPADYIAGVNALSGTLNFAAAQTTATISLTLVGDDAFEALPPEIFTVQLSNPSNASVATGLGTATITDDDVLQTGTVQFTAATFDVNETEVAVNASVTVTRNGGTDGAASVECSATAGSATAGADFTAGNVTVTWLAGEGGSRTCLIPIAGDALDEIDETVLLALVNATGATAGAPANAVLTILDNDAPPVIALAAPAATAEGDTPTITPLVFTATLSTASGRDVSGLFTTADGTALVANADYAAANQVFTIPAGALSTMFNVNVTGDDTDEADETFTATLSDLDNATPENTPEIVTATILNDDAPPPPAGQLRFSSATYSVSENGVTAVALVERVNGSAGAVSVECIASAGTASAADASFGTQVIGFADGVSASQPCTIAIANDALNEDNETVMLALANVTGGATLDAPSSATLTIVDDDPLPTVSINDLALPEGNGPGSTVFAFTATLSAPSGRQVTVQAMTGGGTANVPGDYAAATATLTFAPGSTTQPFAVNVVGDNVDEPALDTFDVTLGAPTNATLGDASGTATIQNDDAPAPPAGTLQFSSPTYSVGEAGVQATIVVTRAGGSNGEVSVTYATANGTAGNTDYTAAGGTLTWTNGDVADKSFVVPIANDPDDEADETVLLSLNTPTGGAMLGVPASAVLTIVDDDAAAPAGTLQFSAATYTVTESGVQATITVTRTGGSAGAVSVSYASVNGTATSGADYTAANGTLSWADADVAAKTFTVPVANDATDEPDETVLLSLSAPTGGATLGAPIAATLTITDDDPPPAAGSLVFSAATYSIGEAGVQATIGVARTGGSAGAVTVSYATANGTATAGADYTAATGTLSWADNDAAPKTFTVLVSNDATDEADETVALSLSNPTGGAALGVPASATLTLVDDDNAVPGVKTFQGPSVTGTGPINLVFTGGGDPCGFVPAATAPALPPAPLPPGNYVFPHGVVGATISNCTVGASLSFTATYPQPLPAGTIFWKYGATLGNPVDHWYAFPAVINGNTATFTLVDGGAGDDDLVANGTIVDPSGPAFPQGGGGIGGAAPITIPATGDAARWLMIALLGFAAAFALRHVRR